MRCWIPLLVTLPMHAHPGPDTPWVRHAVDDTSRGADGVRLSDVNGDDLPDIVTGWEEGGVTRAYLHPGVDQVGQPWPKVDVGKTPSVEDAVWADLDGDGATDVVTSCEGGTRSLFVHWAPKASADFLDAEAWARQSFPAAEKVTSWMFAVPMQVDGKHGPDLVVGSKSKDAMIGWLEAPADPRNVDDWKLHKLTTAGWIMSIRTLDLES